VGQQDACARSKLDHVRDAEARTARNTAVNSAPSMPRATRTTAPASLTSTIGAVDASGRRRLGDNRHETRRRRARCLARHRRSFTTRCMPPRKDLLRTHLPATRHFRYAPSWHQRLLDDPRLLSRRPAPTFAFAGTAFRHLIDEPHPLQQRAIAYGV